MRRLLYVSVFMFILEVDDEYDDLNDYISAYGEEVDDDEDDDGGDDFNHHITKLFDYFVLSAAVG